MPIPVWAVGQVLSANDVNQWFVPLAALKPSDTARASTTSITNDPDLQLSLAANAMYDVSISILYKGGTNGSSDGTCQINAPGGATGFWIFQRLQITTFPTFNFDVANSFANTRNFGTNGTGTSYPLFIKVSVTTTTAGVLAFAWAQNTSNATATTVQAGSLMLAQRLG